MFFGLISHTLILDVVAIYCLAAWLYLAFRTFRYREDHEQITSWLGLCFILAVGFHGLM